MRRPTLVATAMVALLASHSWAQDQQKTHFEQLAEAARRLAAMEPVVAIVDILPVDQQVAFVSQSSGCRFYGTVGFSDQSHAWIMSIDTESCGNETHRLDARVLPNRIGLTIPEGSALLHAGDGAILERNWQHQTED